MDKFLTHAGQQPIFLGDIDFFDKSVRDTFARIVKAMTLGQDSAILSGFETTLEGEDDIYTMTWTAGIVMIEGEILPIEAGTIHGHILSFWLVKVSSYDDTGRRILKTGSEVDCYEIHKATVVSSTVAPTNSHSPYLTTKRFDEILTKYIQDNSVKENYLVNYSNADNTVSLKIYMIGVAYYLFYSGTAEVNNDGLLISHVATESLSRNMISALTTPGITLAPLTICNNVDSNLAFNSFPVQIKITEDTGPFYTIKIQIKTQKDVAFRMQGNIFTRLNTLSEQ